MASNNLAEQYGATALEGEVPGVHDNPRNKYRHNLRDLLESEEVAEADKQPIVEFLDALDPDSFTNSFVSGDGNQETKSVGTLHSYAHNLKRVAVISETPLVEYESADAINQLFDAVSTGDHPHPSVKASGYSAGTLKGWQSAVSKFYEYHDDLGIDPAKIIVARQGTSKVDERDMFTVEEVQDLREACDNPRDRCLLELLLNTGLRIRAIQTLRVKDVDPEESVYWLNDEVAGLKGADESGGKRPLLAAKQAVYDWLQYHPKPDPDAALITVRPGHNRGTPGEELAQSTMRRALAKIAKRADVDKPPNPHNFRHYFVTVAKREYGMDDSTIKYLIGHSADSTIMETTYQHLSDEDYIKDAEINAGLREPEESTSPLSPEVCPTCSNQLVPDSKACDRCGAVFTPDAQAAKDEFEDRTFEQGQQAEPGSEEAIEIDKLRRAVRDNPDAREQVLDAIMDGLESTEGAG